MVEPSARYQDQVVLAQAKLAAEHAWCSDNFAKDIADRVRDLLPGYEATARVSFSGRACVVTVTRPNGWPGFLWLSDPGEDPALRAAEALR